MSASSLHHPVVVLTGGSSGIGRATARAFARGGARLVLAARGRDGLDAVARECRRLGADVVAVPTDVTNDAAVRALADAAIDRFGHIDVWVNNVGVGAVGLFDEVPIAAHRPRHRVQPDRAHERRPRGAVALPATAARHADQHGVGGRAGRDSYAAAYVASKFALRGLSQSLRADVAGLPDIHVCEVYPTFVDTPGMVHGANYTGRRLKPPPPLLDPRAVAEVVVSLVAAPRSSVSVGSPALPARLAHAVAPDLVGRVARAVIALALRRADRVAVTDGNLFAPSVGHAIDGGYRARPGKRLLGGAGLLTGVLAIGWLVLRTQQSRD